jgi:dissimilatory sulfite reductase related protein
MIEKIYAGIKVQLDEEGYFTDSSQWNKEIAVEIAKEEGIELTETHFAIFKFIREKVEHGEPLTIRSIGRCGATDIKGFYQLFPGAPLKKASKCAGVPKPTSCI